jgi:hypothetical protein
MGRSEELLTFFMAGLVPAVHVLSASKTFAHPKIAGLTCGHANLSRFVEN